MGDCVRIWVRTELGSTFSCAVRTGSVDRSLSVLSINENQLGVHMLLSGV